MGEPNHFERERQALDERLFYGAISQEEYDAAIQSINDDEDAYYEGVDERERWRCIG